MQRKTFVKSTCTQLNTDFTLRVSKNYNPFTGIFPISMSWGSGLDCGSGYLGSIPSIRSPRVGPLMARRLTTSEIDVFGRPGVHVGVGSVRLRHLSAHDVGCPTAGLNFETGQLSRHFEAEISLNMTLNLNQPTNQPTVSIRVCWQRQINLHNRHKQSVVLCISMNFSYSIIIMH